MKFLAILLSFFLLGLSILPCAEKVVKDNLESISVNAEHNHDHGDAEEQCSPLCYCQNPILTYIPNNFFPTLPEKKISLFKLQTYTDLKELRFVPSILQPPRI